MTATRSAAFLTCLLLTLGRAAAHDVPVAPNDCTFEPIEIATPLGVATVAVPGAGAAVRIVYSAATRTAQFQAATVPPRAFAVGGVDGALGLPAVFATTLSDRGDLVFPPVPLTLRVDGVDTVVPVPLTTGLVAGAEALVAGAPVNAGGSGGVTLVGVVPAGVLPAPLDVGPTTLRLQCALVASAPDLDQFAATPTPAKLKGNVTSAGGRMQLVVRGSAEVAADPAAGPAAVLLTAGGAPFASLQVPGGLVASGKELVGTTSDGARIRVRARGRLPKWTVKLELATATVPAASGPVSVEATLQLGTLLVRQQRPFKAKNGRLRAR
ncbi:MAG: hypothetical protein KIT14_16320 [bacterium]|nr:hypothetical protein [bacterium]